MSPVLRVVKEGAIQAEIDAALAAALAEQKGAANGLAPLDAGSKVPVLYLPGGAGSGLDADRLQGRIADEFLLKTGGTMTGALETRGDITRRQTSTAQYSSTKFVMQHDNVAPSAQTVFFALEKSDAGAGGNALFFLRHVKSLSPYTFRNLIQYNTNDEILDLLGAEVRANGSKILSVTDFGTGAGKVTEGSDTRLTNARTPTPHNLFSDRHPDVDVADIPTNGEVLTFDAVLGKWVSAAAGGVLVATEARQGTVKGNAPASETTDPAVYFRSDPIHAGFRDGCVPHWQSATDIRVRPGAVWIPALRRIMDVPAELTIVPALAANTFGYLYVYDSAGTPAVELSTTAPVNAQNAGFTNPSGFPLRGACRVKGPAATPDFSRRYVGAVLATATANQIHGFRYEGNTMLYRADPGVAPFLIVNGGGAGTNLAVSFAPVVPPTSRTVLIDGFATTGFFYLQTTEDAHTDTAVTGSVLVQGSTAALHYVDLNASQAALYEASAATGATIRALGYMEAR